ncbi:Ankyrin repeat-like protein [Mizuhopecten yessoensis]|uniref:Ankyrin repeat-like protein n=2 Tax=Mizuhopecten yessoensis TaxID=6573 RepID=A0A210R4M5_MIZYE|nr:Ankyrin repeat-like protein [Mizuhopecten yessoensis]
MTTKQPSPVSRQSTSSSKQSFDTRKSIVSVSGINMETGSLATLPASVESPEPLIEEYNPMLNGVKKKLLTAARKCDTNTFVSILEEWQNLNLNFVDDSGKTLLHLCANVGNKNDVILLLQRNCPVNRIDNMGHSALHYVAKKDYADIAELLIVNGAHFDLPEEKTGQTALHFAVAKNYVATVELLVFSGASVQIKDKNNRTPIALCRSKEIHALLSTAVQSSGGYRPGEMTMQTVEVQGGGITECWKLGLTIDYSTGPADDKFSLMCRRQTTDESDLGFGFENSEDVCSDAFQYRLGRTGKPTPVRLTVPIYSGPNAKEEIVLRTDKGHVFSTASLNKVETDTPYAVAVVDISQFSSFILVCRPQTDLFKIPVEGGTFTSKINPNVGVTVQANTFSKDVKLVLQTISIPNPSVLGSDGMKDIVSMTSFSSLKAENRENPKIPIQLRLPPPNGGKNLKLVSADVTEVASVTDMGWSVRDDPLSVTPDGVELDISDGAMKVIMEAKPGTEMVALKPQIGLVFQKSTHREYSIVFIVLTKHDKKNNTFKTVVECNTEECSKEAKKKWINDGFIDQRPGDVLCYKGPTRQRYKIIASKNLRPQGAEDGFMIFQFHPKRSNFSVFTASVKNNVQNETGNVRILEYKIVYKTAAQLETEGPAKPVENLLTNVHITFDKSEKDTAAATVPLIQVQEPTDIEKKPAKPPVSTAMPRAPAPAPAPAKPATAVSKPVKYQGGKGTEKVFTNDEFLYTVVKELDDEWYKIVVMMGWNFPDVEKELLNSNGTQQDKIMHFMKEWQEKSRTRDDLGLPNLLTALAKGGRRDLCTVVSLQMKEWFDQHSNQKSNFWKWVQMAFKDSDLINPGDYPKPMSDQFLLLLAQALKPSLDIAGHLDIQKTDMERLKKGNGSDEFKMLKVLLQGRDGAQSHIVALRKLLDAMITLDMQDGIKWTMVASKQWFDMKTEMNTQFKAELHDILESYGTSKDIKTS